MLTLGLQWREWDAVLEKRMTPKDYLKARSKVRNNQMFFGPIEEDGPYCPDCFHKSERVERVAWDSHKKGWTCPNGHFLPNQPYPGSQTY